MAAILNLYLGFRGNAREAIEFYRSVFGGDLTLSTFGEMNASEVPEEQDWVMHAQLSTPSGFTIMASDTPSRMEYTPGTNISVSLSGGPDTDAELHGYWDGLADGATITQPLVVAPWGDAFGMLVDKVGTTWLVNIGGPAQAQG